MQSREVQGVLSVNSRLATRQATQLLAKAAACEEALQLLCTAARATGEAQLWFLVRALCYEHGFEYGDVVEDARNFVGVLIAGSGEAQ